jgi:hypothetical protein
MLRFNFVLQTKKNIAMEKFKTVKEAKGLNVGEKVNTFVGEDIHGNKISLSELLKEQMWWLYLLRNRNLLKEP